MRDVRKRIYEDQKNQIYQNASELIADAYDHSREVSKRKLVGHHGIRVPVPRPRPALELNSLDLDLI